MTRTKAGADDATGPSRDDAHLLREILRTHQVVLAAFLETLGMPPSRVVLMRRLQNAPEAIGAKELASTLGVNASVVARQLGEMEEDGLVLRRVDPADKRRHFVELSARGRKACLGIHERSRKLERALTLGLGTAETRVAAEVLSKLRKRAVSRARIHSRAKSA